MMMEFTEKSLLDQMTDNELLRYSRQIMLNNFGVEKQQTLKNSTTLIIGVGGLGSISSMYLASSGVGHIILADFDKVELSNLQRQIVHTTDDIDKLKIDSAKETLSKINPEIKLTTVNNVSDNLDFWVDKADVVLDGTDNFASRFAINASCVKNKTPLVSAAVIKWEGQISTFKGYEKNSVCYECLYKQGSENNTCSENGIIAPMAGIVGSLQALETIKILTNMDNNLVNNLLLIDGLTYAVRRVKLTKDKNCAMCRDAEINST
jgi:adenylyltransferase/sulfurtransferase